MVGGGVEGVNESTGVLMEFFRERFAPCDARSYEWCDHIFKLYFRGSSLSFIVSGSTVKLKSGLLPTCVVDLAEPGSLARVDEFVGLVKARFGDE